MELLGDILSYHQSCSADIPHSSQAHHRMAYAGTAIFTIKLLQTILPPEKVCVPGWPNNIDIFSPFES